MEDIKNFIKWLRERDQCERERNIFFESEDSKDYDFIYLDNIEELYNKYKKEILEKKAIKST